VALWAQLFNHSIRVMPDSSTSVRSPSPRHQLVVLI
jgi:hypothetical protein